MKLHRCRQKNNEKNTADNQVNGDLSRATDDVVVFLFFFFSFFTGVSFMTSFFLVSGHSLLSFDDCFPVE